MKAETSKILFVLILSFILSFLSIESYAETFTEDWESGYPNYYSFVVDSCGIEFRRMHCFCGKRFDDERFAM